MMRASDRAAAPRRFLVEKPRPSESAPITLVSISTLNASDMDAPPFPDQFENK
jgi:hypothetical protein